MQVRSIGSGLALLVWQPRGNNVLLCDSATVVGGMVDFGASDAGELLALFIGLSNAAVKYCLVFSFPSKLINVDLERQSEGMVEAQSRQWCCSGDGRASGRDG